MKNRIFSVISFGVVACSAVAAAPMATVDKDPAHVKTGNYSVDPTHARVQFSLSHLGFTNWYGDFTGVTGGLYIDAKDVARSKVDITVPVDSVTTTNTTLDGELKSAQWLDSKNFPTMHFVSKSVTRTGRSSAKIAGNLTFQGVTKPIVLDATFNASGFNPIF